MTLFGNAKLGKELRNEGIKGEIASAARFFLLLKAQELCYIRNGSSKVLKQFLGKSHCKVMSLYVARLKTCLHRYCGKCK